MEEGAEGEEGVGENMDEGGEQTGPGNLCFGAVYYLINSIISKTILFMFCLPHQKWVWEQGF